MALDYKQISTYFSSIAYHHEQISSFGIGDLKQLTNDVITKQTPQYPRMYVVPENVVLNQNQIHYNYNIVIMDQLNSTLSNQKEVLSDTLAIAMDIWTIFYQSYTAESGDFSQIIVGDWQQTIQPWIENFETILAGWTLQISLVAPFDYSKCGLPMDPDFNFVQDAQFTTYNQIVTDFQTFANDHEQVRSFGFGDVEQLTNDVLTQVEPLYPRLYMVPQSTSLQQNVMVMTWQVIVADRLNSTLSNQQDVLNDTLEICKDLFAKAYLSDYSVQWDAQVTPWLEQTETILAGWSMLLNVQQKFDFNRCTLPVSSFVTSTGLTWDQITEMWQNKSNQWNQN